MRLIKTAEPEQAPFLALPPGGVSPDLCWWLRAADGIRLRAGIWRAPRPRGQVLLLPGRTEYLEQQALPAAHLLRRGLDVVSLDWRGQGLADRLTAGSPLLGHVADFVDFQADIAALLSEPHVAEGAEARIVLGNSMGGAIALAALGRRLLGPVRAAVLTAPMFGIAMGGPSRLTVRVIITTASFLGLAEHWPPGLQGHIPFALRRFEDNLVTRDREYWEWMAEIARAWPALTIGLPSFGWLAAASRAMDELRRAPAPDCPVLCLIGSEEQVVDVTTIRQGCARIGARVAEIPGARHLLLAEAEPMRSAAWAAIDGFLTELDDAPG